ncbi:pectate lyase [Halalkalibacter alkalisediminis]|uniref:Pectate lyase n=1 Tax=Halalkalibacter alkalisediminis TaxID=935616 RepID=A0ABV6NI32_9BACI|nr:pectate lyase [Halalkalibacter alkalisediminis]
MKKGKRIWNSAFVFLIIIMSIMSTVTPFSQIQAAHLENETGIYEAEEAKLEAAIIDNKHQGYTGSGFVDYVPNAPGGWIEWTVNVHVDGEYVLDFRYAHGGTDLRPKEIIVNDTEVNSDLAFDPTGGWASWEYTSMKATLQAGENVIRATALGGSGGANIDHLRVTMEFDKVFEAEEANFEAAIIDNKHIGYTGTGFVDYVPNAPGGWIEWVVDMPVAGMYNLDFRYAHGGTDLRPKEISVNGEVVEPELAFDPSGGWAVWVYSSTQAHLSEGENVIRATGNAANGGANLDHLRIHNTANASESASVDVEAVELTEVLSGLQLKQLNELGILVNEEAVSDDQLITRIEFMSLINDAFGFRKEEKFKNLTLENKVWEVSLDEWYSYVLEAAKEAGYMKGLEDHKGEMKPEEELTKRDIFTILRNLQISNQLYKAPGSKVTWEAARDLVNRIATEHANKQVTILSAHTVTNNLIAVTLDSYFEEFDFNDIDVVVPTKEWATLSLDFKKLRIDKAAIGTNKFGQTVMIMHSLDEWDENAEYRANKQPVQFAGDLDAAKQKADNLISWQMDHGGWTKAMEQEYARKWDGSEPRSTQFGVNGEELGTIDNDATIKEILFLSQVYQETGDERYKESVKKGFDFLLKMQYPTGGFPQVYPKRGTPNSNVYYSNYVTFNDEAMINVLELMDDVLNKRYPFETDLMDEQYYSKLEESLEKGIDYILNAQIEVDGKLTAWCAQHDPSTYEPQMGRSYELPSISGSESVGIVRFLMSRPNQTEEIKQAIVGALNWFDEVKLEGTRYVSGDPNNIYFVEDPNSVAWYRFYEVGTNKGIFSGRDGVKKYNILEIEEERRNGYAWGGHWAQQLLAVSQSTGNFTDKVFVKVVQTKSVDRQGKTLKLDDIHQVGSVTKKMEEIESHLTVAKDGSGDYTTIQEAIDAVPSSNTVPVTIYVKNGVYKEVVTISNDKPFITLIGESATDTIITYDNYAGKDNGGGGTLGTSGSASVYLRASDFRAENLTFENSFDESSTDVSGKQAVAVYASGDRMYFKNIRFIGNQDTLYTHSGSQYFYQCYIEGDVDFIFGAARVVIEESHIHSLDRGSSTNNGYVTAASTLITDPFGMLIKDSKLTSDAPAGTVYLGRPWPAGGNPNAIGSVVFMNSELGEHIHPLGWTQMSGLQPEDARLFEYKNHGPGAIINESRRQLTDEEAEQWTVPNVLKGWDPTVIDEETQDKKGKK